MFQAVVCVLSKAQRKLPEDGPNGPKHIEANIKDILIVNFNILYV